jgi:molybdate transport system ATP-binding protein
MGDAFMVMESLTVRSRGALLLDRLDWIIEKGEQWVVTGPSGGGKTVLANAIMGRHFYSGRIEFPSAPSIAMVEQQHRFRNLPGSTDLYYQQRFNSSDADQTITVAQELAEQAGLADPLAFFEGSSPSSGARGKWLDLLHILPLLNKPLVQLSNGENKRVQLAIALLEDPGLLILDHPFLGLDTEGRDLLRSIIGSLSSAGMQIILLTGPHEIPPSITHIAQLDRGRWVFKGPVKDFHPAAISLPRPDEVLLSRLLHQPAEAAGFLTAVKMVRASIQYGDTRVLQDIDWEVRKGDRWNISGPNGSGKSTLLSLITADNPQAYANEIWLFDRRRGSGESIWDIKRRIGFVSPELHLYFDRAATVFDVIASGLFDTVGLLRRLSPGQEDLTMRWMEWVSGTPDEPGGSHALRHKRLFELSAGQQRKILLARALIKCPPLLVLDEPCQGLDEEQTAAFRELIDMICSATDTTLIYVSHYPLELPSSIDKFLKLEDGRIKK